MDLGRRVRVLEFELNITANLSLMKPSPFYYRSGYGKLLELLLLVLTVNARMK
jgi:hypothetical protein